MGRQRQQPPSRNNDHNHDGSPAEAIEEVEEAIADLEVERNLLMLKLEEASQRLAETLHKIGRAHV